MKLLLKSAAILAAVVVCPQVQAQQIITAINIDNDAADYSNDASSAASGQYIGDVYQGSDAHAQTSYGVNKVYASATNGSELSATSAWLDTFTVQGNAGDVVHLNFSFTVDGAINYSSSPYFNFQVYALRGDGWTINGTGNAFFANEFSPRVAGTDYDDLFFQRVVTGGSVIQFANRADEKGMFNYANNGGTAGAIQSNVSFNEAGNVYTIKTVNPTNPQSVISRLFYADHSETWVDGVQQPAATVYYNAGTPAATQLLQTRISLQSNYSLIDSAELCPNDVCAQGQYLPTTVTVAFDLVAGSKFSLAGVMVIDSLENGTIDFFNTARLTGVEVTNVTTPGSAVSLISEAAGGALPTSGGQIIYTPAVDQTAAVPEPATWAMMIGGLGLVGASLRRRSIKTAIA